MMSDFIASPGVHILLGFALLLTGLYVLISTIECNIKFDTSVKPLRICLGVLSIGFGGWVVALGLTYI